ncbi:MAG: DUF5011 domain-containing protein, partial [Bacilli bacterium]|nr:DUF5011 domain-containing protein [Bacilli bacterium]
ATDQSGNHTTQTLRTVHVVDLESPEILLVGQSTLYISVNEAYVDMGASCIDNYDLACTVTINTDNLNTNLIGTYTVSYTAVDASNNIAIEATRTIIVQNAQNRIPSITQNDVIYHLVNQPWTYPTLYVPYEGDYLATRQGSVDESTLGTYDILYQITDELNNVFELHVLVIVVTDLPDELLFLNLQNIYNYYPSLYAILRDFDQNQDLYLDTQEASTITSLDVSGMNIKNIDFLSYLTNLNTLTVDDNNLYDLDFLENLTHLETLSARHNFLEASDLCVLSDSNLKHLDLSDNYISNLDCLVSMDSLADLNVMDNILSSIPLLASSSNLTQLNISHNSIDTLDDLLPYTNLITLDISNTLITDIYDIDFLSKLQNITLNENITNYYPIDYLPELKTVIIDQLDADLEQSFFFDYLMTYGISVTTKSMTSFDFVYPNILLLEDSKIITQGDTLDYSSLDLIVYDYYDLYMSEQIISSVPDTSVLTPGVHTITLSFTDSEGNTSSTNFEIQVLEDYDLGNIVIFIRFADELDFVSPLSLAYYNDLFNGTSSSLRDYYLEVSNNAYNINTILPEDEIIFFTDTYTRAYYQPYDEITNPIGYQDDDEGYYREQELLGNAINFVDAMGIFGDEEVLDYDNDDVIDVITFLISGQVDDWADLIWPHKYAMYTSIDAFGDFLEDAPTIHGKYAYEYTFQLIGDSETISPYFDLSTFAHEMFHIIGAPDLYHYYSDDDIDPTGYWGLMNSTYDMPVHMLGYMKETYGNWDQDEIIVQLNGTYVLNRTTLETNNLLVIDLGYSNEYLYLEYRTQNGEYEINLPGEGLLIYRVDSDYYLDGNVYGYYDESEVALEEVYLFRPSTFDNIRLANEGIYVIVDDGDPEGAVLSLQGINSAGPETTIPLFHSDGTPIHITITVVQEDTDSVTVQITWND